MVERYSFLDMKTLILGYAISTVQYNSRMKVGNTINIDYTLLCTDMYTSSVPAPFKRWRHGEEFP